MGGQPDARLRKALVGLTPRQQAALLRVPTRSPTHRAKTIVAIYGTPEGRHVAELLIDLERTTFFEQRSRRPSSACATERRKAEQKRPGFGAASDRRPTSEGRTHG